MDSRVLLNKGFSPLPVPKGRKYPKGVVGWDALLDWKGEAPGLGLNLRGLAMVDFDVKKPVGIDTENWVQALAEAVHSVAPVRYRDGSPSMALLVRCPEGDATSHYLCTSKWHTADVEARVEVKVGQGHFMFAWGRHPSGADLKWILGEATSKDPADFPDFRDLPIMSLAQLGDAVTRLEAALRKRFGDAPVSEPRRHDGWADVHDLRWDMRFTLPEGGESTLEELWHAARRDGDAWANLTPWRPESDSGAGHIVECRVHPGYPAIFDFARYERHFFDLAHEFTCYPAIEVPADLMGMTFTLNDLPNEAQKDRDVVRMEATHRLVYVRELGKYAYADDPEGSLMMREGAFHEYEPKDQAELARGVRAVQRLIWDPEQEGLTTVVNDERGWEEHNTFCLPKHATRGGNLDGFLSWFEGFIPDPVERQTLMLWLAHKVQRPHERMFTLVLVGDPGSGKGTLWKVVQKLWGHRTVAQVGNIQSLYSQYQDALFQTLWVLVDEVSLEDATRIGKKLAQERLKAFCEPQASYKLLNIKGKPQQHAKVCASVGIATNNINALPLDANDRRFYVASTRGEMSRREVEAIHGWLASKENVGALWRWLAAKHVPMDFNPMRAPDSATKDTMAAVAMTDVETAINELRRMVLECGGVCTAAQAYTFLSLQELEPEDHLRFRKMFRGSFPKKMFNGGKEYQGRTFQGYMLNKEARERSGKEAIQSVLRVDEGLNAMQRKRDAEPVF
jgi:hypothetical protein